MPMIALTTSVDITGKEMALKEGFGQAITLLPGKTEDWLMISMTGNTPIFFQGEARNAAFLNITSFGPIDPDAYDDMTDVVCVLLEEELGIDPVNVNIVYNETVNWGWNGSNL